MFSGQSTGTGSKLKIGTKNTISLSANSSVCEQSTDESTGLIYQQADCNSQNGLLLKIALCSDNNEHYEVFINIGSPPTTKEHVKRTVLTKDMFMAGGYYKLMFDKDSFEMPPPGSKTKCIIGVRQIPSKCWNNYPYTSHIN